MGGVMKGIGRAAGSVGKFALSGGIPGLVGRTAFGGIRNMFGGGGPPGPMPPSAPGYQPPTGGFMQGIQQTLAGGLPAPMAQPQAEGFTPNVPPVGPSFGQGGMGGMMGMPNPQTLWQMFQQMQGRQRPGMAPGATPGAWNSSLNAGGYR